jgi:hypothetical protein
VTLVGCKALHLRVALPQLFSLRTIAPISNPGTTATKENSAARISSNGQRL